MLFLCRQRVLTRYSLASFAAISFALLVAIALFGLILRLNDREASRDRVDGYFTPRAEQSDVIGSPHVVFWAWERPEDLRFLDRRGQGVAFLARTIELRSLPAGNETSGDPGVYLRPRLQPLRVAEGAPLIAVVRIESSNDLWHRPVTEELSQAAASPTFAYTDAQRELVAALAADAARLPKVAALQIDFDASRSERRFYGALLEDLRARIPKGMPLSITALTSWCMGDNWLDRLPPGTIDEAVPMLFRMGPDGANVASYLKSGKDFSSHLCRSSLGVSTDEPFSRVLLNGAIQPHSAGWHARRVYVFSPQSWAKQDADTVTREVEQWHND